MKLPTQLKYALLLSGLLLALSSCRTVACGCPMAFQPAPEDTETAPTAKPVATEPVRP